MDFVCKRTVTGTAIILLEIIWLNNRPVAQIRTLYSAGSISSQDIYYIQVDHLNTPRWIANQKGNRIWSWESDAFGLTIPNMDVDSDGTNFFFNMRFPGQFCNLSKIMFAVIILIYHLCLNGIFFFKFYNRYGLKRIKHW
ncbi:MAG: hypothetical protein L3J52_01765 [Proteobacteria bacterium]|nr:hypothetical protein [Pseudomonadota bacterium]